MPERRVIFRRGHVAVTGLPAGAQQLPPTTGGGGGGGGQGHGKAVGRGHGRGGVPAAGLLAFLAAASRPAASEHPTGRAPVGTVTDLGNATGSGSSKQVNAALVGGEQIVVAYIHSGNHTATVSDDGGNDYTTHSGTALLTIINWRVGWAFASIVNPATAVTVTFSGSSTNVLRVWQLGGLISSGALDKSVSALNESAQPNSGPTGTLSQKDELALEMAYFTNNAGWTPDFAHDLGKIDASTIVDLAAAWKQVSTVASITAAPTLNPGQRNWCVALTFRLA